MNPEELSVVNVVGQGRLLVVYPNVLIVAEMEKRLAVYVTEQNIIHMELKESHVLFVPSIVVVGSVARMDGLLLMIPAVHVKEVDSGLVLSVPDGEINRAIVVNLMVLILAVYANYQDEHNVKYVMVKENI